MSFTHIPLSQVTTPAPRIGTPSPPALLVDSPASSSSSGPRRARPVPRPITQTSDSPSGSAPAPLSPLVTAPILVRNSAQSDASLADDDLPARQTDCPTALANKKVPTDTPSGTSAAATTLRPHDDDNSNGNNNSNNNSNSNDNSDDNDNDNSVLNPAPASNPNNTGRLPRNSSILGPSSAPASSKKPKKITGKYVVCGYLFTLF